MNILYGVVLVLIFATGMYVLAKLTLACGKCRSFDVKDECGKIEIRGDVMFQKIHRTCRKCGAAEDLDHLIWKPAFPII
jgi:hypothetical protein